MLSTAVQLISIMSPDVEDVSSPEPGAEQDDAGTMADEDNKAAADEKSPTHKTNASSQPASKSNAKDPSRPRRKKARRACFACQRAHLTCGEFDVPCCDADAVRTSTDRSR